MEFRRRKRRGSALELTPLIDVVFQLLVFFLLTASFVQPSLRLDLPSGEASDEPDAKPILVEIDASGTLRVDGDVIRRDGLEEALRAALEDDRTAVRLSGDREPAFQEWLLFKLPRLYPPLPDPGNTPGSAYA
ncbi:MAG: biopolymer transporter ExbD [Planctomycetota bacterium]